MNKYGRELELILMLTSNSNYTAAQMADKLGISRRNLYNYFDYLRECGFTLVKSGTRYYLDRNASFFRRLHENISITADEAEYMLRILAAANGNDTLAATLRSKLTRQFGLPDISNPEIRKQYNRNVAVLKDAIAARMMVKLCGYSSSHSATVSDRIVEPFLFMNESRDVRCHEISTHQNKTFKIARMSSVEMLDVPWIAEKEHKQAYTDLFMFSGETRHTVTMLLGRRSHNLLVEEYPAAADCIRPEDGRWLFTTDVVSFLGVGRFVLGLYDDIRILGDEEFLSYIRAKIDSMGRQQSE
ncbi:MAG: helix-turn-helix transcriptional regulator [Prevotella sp.]